MLLSGFRVVVFDVDGEFRSWCDAWGGTWVDHAPGSGRYVEPMRIAPRPGGYGEMAARVAAVVSLLAGAGGLDALGENVVDKVTATTCRLAGIDPADEATWGRPVRLRDWYAVLAAMGGWEVAAGGRTGGVAGPAVQVGQGSTGRPAGSGATSGADATEAETVAATTAHGPGDPPRNPLEAAVLALVQRDPDLGERSLAHALAAEGGTQGRVYRSMQRYGLETRAKRRRWAEERDGGDTRLRAAVAEAARRLAGEDRGLEPLWRYHLATAWCRLREGLSVPEVLPVVDGIGIAAPDLAQAAAW
jgi:hypothetical protein